MARLFGKLAEGVRVESRRPMVVTVLGVEVERGATVGSGFCGIGGAAAAGLGAAADGDVREAISVAGRAGEGTGMRAPGCVPAAAPRESRCMTPPVGTAA